MECIATAPPPSTNAPSDHPVATIVFVGCDPSVVHTVRSAAQSRHEIWDVHHADSGEAALELVEHLPNTHVVVANVHVIGTPVGEILAHVREHSPHTARIIVSHESDRDTVMELIGSAHRYLSLPTDLERLVDVIEHVRGSVGSELGDPVRSLIGQVDRLPSPPALFQRLSSIMVSDDWSIREVADEISRDVGLTGEILKLVNSSFFGNAAMVTSVDRAIPMIGMNLVRFVVLGNRLFESNDGLETWLDLERLDRRSNDVAHAARGLALRERASTVEAATAYLTGMVSEIGLLVMARIPDISPSIAKPLNGGTFPGAERAIFGGDRFEVGCRLLRLWGFDRSVADAVERLSQDETGEPGLHWHVSRARTLVLDQGFDPHELASPVGVRPDVDEAIDQLQLNSA